MNIKQIIDNYKGFDKYEISDTYSFKQFLELLPKNMWAVRDNTLGHLTASAIVLNKDKTKMLMAYHNIYKCWAWFGGHADGDLDLANVCLKELEEETGINKNKFVQINSNGQPVIDISAIAVGVHEKKGKVVSEHIHYNLTYVFEVDEAESLSYRDDEHSGIGWIDIKEFFTDEKYQQDSEYIMHIYKRILIKSGLELN